MRLHRGRLTSRVASRAGAAEPRAVGRRAMELTQQDVVWVFGETGAKIFAAAEVVASGFGDVRYQLEPNDLFTAKAKTDLARAHAAYWRELLHRAHLGGAVALLRNLRWCRGMAASARDANLFAFSASFRGLVESAGDGWDSLGAVPTTLATNHRAIEDALSGSSAKTFFAAADLESALIEFSHARKLKKNEIAPPEHRAKPTAEYVRLLDEASVPRAGELYQLLCALTHPAAASVSTFLESDDGERFVLASEPDAEAIRYLTETFATSMTPLLEFAFNLSFLLLGVLNRLPVSEVHCASLGAFRIEGIRGWKRLVVALAH